MNSKTNSLIEIDSNFSSRDNIKAKFNSIFLKSLKFATALFTSLFSLFSLRLSSASAVVKGVNVYDLYGRVPHDNWLFTTWRLTDPNLLKRSYVECVSNPIQIFIGDLL